MKRVTVVSTILLLLVLLAGCVGTPEAGPRPDWAAEPGVIETDGDRVRVAGVSGPRSDRQEARKAAVADGLVQLGRAAGVRLRDRQRQERTIVEDGDRLAMEATLEGTTRQETRMDVAVHLKALHTEPVDEGRVRAHALLTLPADAFDALKERRRRELGEARQRERELRRARHEVRLAEAEAREERARRARARGAGRETAGEGIVIDWYGRRVLARASGHADRGEHVSDRAARTSALRAARMRGYARLQEHRDGVKVRREVRVASGETRSEEVRVRSQGRIRARVVERTVELEDGRARAEVTLARSLVTDASLDPVIALDLRGKGFRPRPGLEVRDARGHRLAVLGSDEEIGGIGFAPDLDEYPELAGRVIAPQSLATSGGTVRLRHSLDGPDPASGDVLILF